MLISIYGLPRAKGLFLESMKNWDAEGEFSGMRLWTDFEGVTADTT